MAGVRCQVIRWISAEPQPGWVEVRLTDANGVDHALFDKPPMFESGSTIGPDAVYPKDVVLDCIVLGEEAHDTIDVELLHVETDAGKRKFTVAREILTF